jgi:endonuclease/exonuclease/phosphatase family metal-dependent hydrolase
VTRPLASRFVPHRSISALRLLALPAVGALVALAALATAGAASRPAAPSSLTVKMADGPYLTWQSGAPGFRVQQSTSPHFGAGVTTYTLRQPGHVFTPVGLRAGTTYYFRIRAARDGALSRWSHVASYTVHTHASALRVLTYNVMSASFDGQKHPSGATQAPFKDRRAPMLKLIANSNADVIGIQEGSSCIVKYGNKPCYRQVDSLHAGLKPKYKLVDTWTYSPGQNRYADEYILFDSNVSRVSHGGTWNIGPSNDQRHAAYQIFKVAATGAKFLFISVHTISARPGDMDAQRDAETKVLLSKAKAFAKNHGVKSVVYVGDFNSYYHEYHVHDLTGNDMRAAGIPDGVAVALNHYRANFDSINGLYRHARKGHGSADHVFVSAGVGVKKWGERLHIDSHGDFIGTIPSDHNPVFADLLFPY